MATQPPAQPPKVPVADARVYSAGVWAATGICLWALQRWVHSIPQDVMVDFYVVIPAVIGYLTAHLVRKSAPGSAPQ